jgi:hypothetical protein
LGTFRLAGLPECVYPVASFAGKSLHSYVSEMSS